MTTMTIPMRESIGEGNVLRSRFYRVVTDVFGNPAASYCHMLESQPVGPSMAKTVEMKRFAPADQPSLDELEAAATLVYRFMPPTPQYRWPLLDARVGTAVWVKHENHTPTGAFKVRGGLVYLDEIGRTTAKPKGVISATRGNHGQSVGFAARQHGIPAAVVVPFGNSVEKNSAMRALGVEVIEKGLRRPL